MFYGVNKWMNEEEGWEIDRLNEWEYLMRLWIIK